MTFKDQHALDTLPGRIEELQAEIEMLRKTLADLISLARTRRNSTPVLKSFRRRKQIWRRRKRDGWSWS